MKPLQSDIPVTLIVPNYNQLVCSIVYFSVAYFALSGLFAPGRRSRRSSVVFLDQFYLAHELVDASKLVRDLVDT